MRDALAKFMALVGRLTEIEKEAKAAEHLPAAYANSIRRVSVHGDGNYSRADPASVERVKAAQTALAVEEQRRGEIDRDEKLRALALEIEGLRAALPCLSAAASIELGTIARTMAGGCNAIRGPGAAGPA